MSQLQLRDPLASLPYLLRSFFEEPGRMLPTLDEGALAIDISESEKGETIVRASLPGYKKEDIHVSVHNGVLDIKASSRHEETTENEKYFRKERRYGAVARRIALPGNPSEEHVNARLEDGVLTVVIKPSQEQGPRRISVD
jgi:HSP20 family protein